MTVFRKVNSTPPVRCSSQHSLFGLNQVSVRILLMPNVILLNLLEFLLTRFLFSFDQEFLPQLEDPGGSKGMLLLLLFFS